MSAAGGRHEGGRSKVGLFGGSFDPIHAGHVATVLAARRQVGLDRVVYLPTARPPHKPERRFAPAWRRFAMVELALLDEPALEVSALELTPGREAFTIDTVETMAERLPDAELHLLIGSDSLAELDTWKRWRELVERVRLVVLTRPGWEPERIRAELPAALRERLPAGPESGDGEEGEEMEPIVFVAQQPLPYAATELRRALHRGEDPPAGALHPRVLDYIRKYRLYR